MEELFVCSSHDYVLFFTSKGKMYRLKGYEIPESSRASRGNNIVNILPVEKDEKITSMIRVGELDEDSYLVMVTKNGVIKRTQLSAYRNVRKGGIIAITLDEGDELAWVRNTTGQNQLIIATRQGMAIRFDENDVRPMGRSARGVRAISLEDGDQVVGMARVHEGGRLLTVSEGGQGRRTDLEEYRLQSRGGKGIRNYYVEKNGPVAGVKVVEDEDDVILITDDGVIIRIPVSDITVQSRYGGGVRVMRIAEGSRVVTLARAPKEEEEDDVDSDNPSDDLDSPDQDQQDEME